MGLSLFLFLFLSLSDVMRKQDDDNIRSNILPVSPTCGGCMGSLLAEGFLDLMMPTCDPRGHAVEAVQPLPVCR